jgi:hypothetical protein
VRARFFICKALCMQTNYLKEVIIMKRTFAIIAVLAAALALPAVAGATNTDSHTATGNQTEIQAAVELGSEKSVTLKGTANPRSGSGAADITLSAAAPLRSNAPYSVLLRSITLAKAGDSGAGNTPITVGGTAANVTGTSNGDAAANDEFRANALTGTGGTISWANNAGIYSGSATIEVSTTY